MTNHKSQMTNLKTALENEDDFLEFLAQEARSDEYQARKAEAESGSHPSDDMLYDYVLGVLNDTDADTIRDHISFCGICAEEVLQIRLAEEELEAFVPDRTAQHPTLWERINIWISWLLDYPRQQPRAKSQHPFLTSHFPLLTSITACLIIIFLWQHNNSQLPKLSVLINESYQIVLSDKKITPDKLHALPWEHSAAFGFGTSTDAPEIRAFGAGLWKGRQLLVPKPELGNEEMPEFLSPTWQNQDGNTELQTDDWTETSWEPYFSMGKWCFLIRTVCMSDEEMTYNFWQKQEIFLKQLHKEFLELPENMKKNIEVIHAALGHIQSVLNASDGKPPDRQSKRAIASEIDNFITYMGPRY